MVKNAQKYTQRLDKVAEELQKYSKEAALQIDLVSDVLEGKREASTLQFDPDEARYMAGRFNYNVKQRDADEPFMDNYNQSNFEQVMNTHRNPAPIKVAYQKIK